MIKEITKYFIFFINEKTIYFLFKINRAKSEIINHNTRTIKASAYVTNSINTLNIKIIFVPKSLESSWVFESFLDSKYNAENIIPTIAGTAKT